MGKIREWLKSFFPMPARSLDRRICGLEDSLRSISAAQEALAERLEKLQDMAEEMRADQRKARKVAAACRQQLETLEQGVLIVREAQKLRGGVEDDMFHRIEYCQERLAEVEHEILDITEGDIFRRIEFTQGKIVRLENLLQQNMLSQEAQRGSSEYRFIRRMHALFPLFEVLSDKPFVRVGRPNDGGYVMLDDFDGRSVAYSIGIADDVSWDRDMADRGLDVYMYDHTIEGIPEENERFHFFRTGIGTEADRDDPLLKTLPEMMAENGHLDTYGMIMKIDVEGAEWPVLRELDEEVLKHFSQIVFEFHGLTDMKKEGDIRQAMEKLNRTHQLAHLHANNFGTYRLLGGTILPELLEGTYLLRGEYEFGERPGRIPTELDEINCPYLPDITLNGWVTERILKTGSFENDRGGR